MESIKMPFDSLVEERRFFIGATTVFVTVSPNPTTLLPITQTHTITGKKKKVKRPYGMLKQSVQYNYCIEIIKEDYIPWLEQNDYELMGVPELNENGNVHFHFLLNSKAIKNDTDLQIFRREILCGTRTQENISKGKHSKDWMNNIVFVTRPKGDIIKYLMKTQNETLSHFPNYVSSSLKPNYVPHFEAL